MKKQPKFAMGLFTACLLFQFALVSLPSSLVAEVRNGIRWIGRPIDWFEMHLPYVSVIHLLSFILIGVSAHLAIPGIRFRKRFCLLLVFATLTEALQFLVPGRNPGAADFIADVLGILIGMGIVFVGSRIARRRGAPAGAAVD